MTDSQDSDIYAQFNEYCQSTATPVTVSGETVTVHHTHIACYDIETVVQKLVDGITFSPTGTESSQEYTWGEEFEQVEDDIERVLEGTEFDVEANADGLSMSLPDEYIGISDLTFQTSTLLHLYYENSDSRLYPIDLELPASTAEYVADLMTMYLQSRITMETIVSARTTAYQFDGTKRDVKEAIKAMRATVETRHGPAVFDSPSPSRETVELLETMANEVGLPTTPEFFYALYVCDTDGSFMGPNDSSTQSLHHSMDNMMRSMLNDRPAAMKWTAEETSEDDYQSFVEREHDRQKV